MLGHRACAILCLHKRQVQTSPSSKLICFIVQHAKSYSVDLRWQVVWLNLAHRANALKISRLLCLSECTVQRYLAMFHQICDIKPMLRKNGPAKLLGEVEQVILLRIILQNPGIYLCEIRVKLQLAFGVRVSAATICRTLKFMGCTRKRMRHVALQQSQSMRAKFMHG